MVVNEVHVLVHPFFAVPFSLKGRHRVFGRQAIDPLLLKSRSSVATLAVNSKRYTSDQLIEHELLQRFYRAQINAISRRRGAHLVILRGAWQKDASELDVLHRTPPLFITDYFDNSRSRLIDYARKRLGKRLVVLATHQQHIGEEVKKLFSMNVPVNVFGEYTELCVQQAVNSLKQSGFQRVKLDSSKSIPQ